MTSLTNTKDNHMTEEIQLNSSQYYLNRQLSLLQFNIRVLAQVNNEEYPPLERVRFLTIFSNNIDQFFEVQVAELKEGIHFGHDHLSADGMRAPDALEEISNICHDAFNNQYQVYNQTLLPLLSQNGIEILSNSQLSEQQQNWVAKYFRREIMPIISPVGLDTTHPFPRLVNKSLNFIVQLEGKDAFGRDSGLAIVPAPRNMPRVIQLPTKNETDKKQFIYLSSIMSKHASDIFPGMTAIGCYQFRITRDADIELNAAEVKDMARALRGELPSRRFGTAVRLEIVQDCPESIIEFLQQEFALSSNDTYLADGPVNLHRLTHLLDHIKDPALYFPPFTPGLPKNLMKNPNWLNVISNEDVLLNHPYESFTPIVDVLRQAANDPNVLVIKQTLYRTGSQSEVVDALVEAARNGKEVTAVIELRARFDEEDNIMLADRLQEAGALVIYGVIGYKCHAKIMLILRRQGRQLKRFAHLGTGNYHSTNAKIYTDYSLFTSDTDLCNDVHKIFQQLTGMGKTVRIRKISHAPFTLKKNLLSMIQHEAEVASDGKPARIVAKVNGLTDPKIIKALYQASQAGVKIELIVRGMCCLRPKIPGVSDNITVRSVVGRLLEHSRVYYFANNTPSVFCSSADLMERNLDNRVEVSFPIENESFAKRIKKELEVFLADNCESWELNSDGSYTQNVPGRAKPLSAQSVFLENLAD